MVAKVVDALASSCALGTHTHREGGGGGPEGMIAASRSRTWEVQSARGVFSCELAAETPYLCR
jgi:hypothetical protein